jgi:hypothetical protein
MAIFTQTLGTIAVSDLKPTIFNFSSFMIVQVNRIILIAFILSSVLLLNSCKKENEVPEPFSDPALTLLAGDFEWTHTKISETEFTTNADLSDKYGLRIEENGKMFLFKNGKLLSEHNITGKSDDLKGDEFFFYSAGDKSARPMYFTGDSIVWITLTPFDWKDNYYYKK